MLKSDTTFELPSELFEVINRDEIAKLSKAHGFEYQESDYASEVIVRYLFIANTHLLQGELGVYTAQDIIPKDNEKLFIDEYFGDVLPEEEAIFLNDYRYLLSARNKQENRKYYYYVNAKYLGNWTRFINHSDNPNLKATIKDKKIMLYAFRPIKAGEQLLLNYGDSYFIRNKIEKVQLNPVDNWLTNQELVKGTSYYEKPIPIPSFERDDVLSAFNLSEKYSYYFVPKIAKMIIDENMGQFIHALSDSRVNFNLPIIPLNDKTQLPFERHEVNAVTPLTLACFLGKVSFVKGYFSIPAIPPNANDKQAVSGCSALHFAITGNASWMGKHKIIKILIKNGANLRSKDSESFMPLHICIKMNDAHSSAQLVKALIEKKKNPFKGPRFYKENKANQVGPLIYALANNRFKCLLSMLRRVKLRAFLKIVFGS